jgi:hypothetical protein
MSGGTVAVRSGGTCDSGTKVAASLCNYLELKFESNFLSKGYYFARKLHLTLLNVVNDYLIIWLLGSN